ncbi:arginine decarboxylase [Clostridiales bacterium]|nr:arginine decarboxylase [Clostridiales bacterium]
MNINQQKTPIIDALKKFDNELCSYFCIPSHHRGLGADSSFLGLVGSDMLKYDLTETPLTDDLHNPDGVIKEAEALAAELFGADRTFFLINGTTCANEAMILSAANNGEKILVARNCHKSVLMGLILSGAQPIYIEPEISTDFCTFGSISPSKVKLAFEKNPDIKAFILTSPTYYGICSDLEAIAEICHSYGALLLVDEAHGSHLSFSQQLPKSALESGADMSAQSIHKTLGSMTQSSMLHVKKRRINIDMVDLSLKVVQSTSPSYILMASLDGARHHMALRGGEAVNTIISTAEYIRSSLNAINGVYCCGSSPDDSVFATDKTRLVFYIDGISGFMVSDMLFKKYNIFTEMADFRNVIIIIGSGDTHHDAYRLIEAVSQIASSNEKKINFKFCSTGIPPALLTPREAFFSPSERITLEKSVGKISAEMIAPYPPGIPVIYPGEIITHEIYEFISNAVQNGQHIHGFSDKTMKTIKTISHKDK